MALHFFTMVTNDRYLGFLRPHLGSVLRHHPDAVVTVYYHNIRPDRLSACRSRFPQITFTSQPLSREESKEQTISGKIRWYAEAAARLNDGEALVFIDCDTLILQPLDGFFSIPFDLAYTWKEDGFPLNTGVVLARSSRSLVRLLHHWRTLVENTFANNTTLELARSRGGGADQYALIKVLHPQGEPRPYQELSIAQRIQLYDGRRTVSIGTDRPTCHGFPCTELNETHCAPVTERTHVIHYKSGWHTILLDGTPFTRNRPEAACKQMYELWKTTAASEAQQTAHHVLLSAVSDQRKHVQSPEPPRDVLVVRATAELLGAHQVFISGNLLAHSTLARHLEDRTIQLRQAQHSQTNVRRLGKKLSHQILQTGEPTLLLLDGKAGHSVVELLADLFMSCPNLVGAFVYGCSPGSETRNTLQKHFAFRAFSDHPDFVARFSQSSISMAGEQYEDSGNSEVPYALILPDDDQTKPLSSWRTRLTSLAPRMHAKLKREVTKARAFISLP